MSSPSVYLQDVGGGAASADAIAIIGIGCRFPGGVVGPASFWQVLNGGVDTISEVPGDRWSSRFFVDPNARNPGRLYSRHGGFVSGVDQFDSQFFGLAPREAAFMDPQQRFLLEVVWEAFEDAGLVAESLSGSRTGVFVGISTHDYGDIQQKDIYTADFYANTGGALSIAANRVSYLFNLRGPSLSVDTACSSSLVAVDLACRSLREGTSDLAIAGGVNCILSPETTMSFSKGSMLSPDGRCKAFDSSANGYVRGEGAGVVVLKALDRARRDGDEVYAVILASGVNQDGRTHGMTVPSREAQERLLREVYRQANVPPDQVVYLEAHGTGTPVGDPIEAAAIGAALGRQRKPDSYLTIGSVKSNIGHLEAASGIAGLIKAALVLEKRTIPPSLHFQEPNPQIPFEDLRLRVPRASEHFQVNGTPAVAGVNSFGFGGTNAHVVLQTAPDRPSAGPRTAAVDSRAQLVQVSARSQEALLASASNLADFLTTTEHGRSARFADVCYSANIRRSHLEHRACFVAASSEELAGALRAFVAERKENLASASEVPAFSGKLAFVFSGMGPQRAGMGRELLCEPVFRSAADRCDHLFRQYAGWSILEAMQADVPLSRMQEAEVAQPANFVLQVGLAELWASWGVTPEAIVGHSAGEVAGAVVAGVLSLEAGVRVIYHRSRLQQRARGFGRMLAAGLSAAEAEAALGAYTALVSIAAINGPKSVTLSGEAHALEAVARVLDERAVFNRFLDVQVPYHSHYMDPLEAELRESLQGLEPAAATVPFYSTVSGTAIVGPEVDASYWWQNVRQPVRFAPALEQLIADGHDRFIELAPHPVLSHSIRETLTARQAPGVALPSLRRDRERATALESLGALYSQGHDVNWHALVPGKASLVKLPTYPWQKNRCWHESEVSARHRLADPPHPLLHRRMESPEPVWDTNVAAAMPDYLQDHAVQGSVVYPAAAYIEMALAAAGQLGCDTPVIEDLELKRALVLGKDAVTQLRFAVDLQGSGFTVHSRPRESGQAWTLHVSGQLRLTRGVPVRKPEHLARLRGRCPAEMSQPLCYASMQERGLQYGPMFQGLRRLWQGRGEAVGRIECPESIAGELAAYRIHPVVLDACFHVLMGAILLDADGQAERGTYLPVQMGRIRFHQRPGGTAVWSHARVTRRNATHLTGDLSIFDDAGRVLMEIESFTCQRVPDTRAADAWTELLYETQWFAKSAGQLGPTQSAGLPGPSAIARSLERPTATSIRFERRVYYEEVDPRVHALCGAYALQALVQLGWTPRKGQRVGVASLATRLGVADHHRRLFARLLEMLAEDGFLKPSAAGWTVVGTRAGTDIERAFDEMAETYPEYQGVFRLVRGCGPHLAEVLAGRQEPLHLVFPEGSMSLVEHLYSESPYNRVYNHLIREVVAKAIRALPRERTLRILEIGAGTGATTAHLLPLLPRHRTEYVFTDVSNAFMAFGRQKLRDYPFLSFQLLDIERSPSAQGFEPHSFDIVIAADALHATKDLRDSLEHARELLRPDGLLVLLEVVKPSRYLDLIFGLLKDWWRFEDATVRGGDHPWMSRAGWEHLLSETGFDDVTTVSDVNASGETGQAVVLARAQEALSTRETLPPAAGAGSRWLIFGGDRGGVGRRLAAAFQAQGAETILVTPGSAASLDGPGQLEVRPDNPDDMRALLASVGGNFKGVVHLWNLDLPEPGEACLGGLELAERLGCVSLLHLVQAVATAGHGSLPRLWVVTRGAQQMPGEDIAPHIAQTPAWGLGRVIANEHPPLRCTLVDLDSSEDVDIADALWREIAAGDAEQEVGLRGRSRYVARIVSAPQAPQSDTTGSTPAKRRTPPFRLEPSRPGVLDSLVLRETTRRNPGAGEVEVQVSAAGLNFRDVMKALGLYPTEDGTDVWLGDECAGTVTKVGPSVAELRPGHSVVAFSSGTFRRFITVPAAQVRLRPANLSQEEAASIPIVFLTALYALKHLAHLSRGERILIHAAAGGVGLAAIQYAQHVGAEVFATAGSPEKRDYLRSLGVQHVMDSRSQAFADEILEITAGKGVGVVLNSLAGEFIPNSMSLLEPSGRFIELGKIDIYQDAKLGLGHFKNGRSFFAVDLGWLMVHRPQLAGDLLTEVMDLFAAGTFRPLPVTSFSIANASDAFRYMAQAKHIGKIALSIPERVDARILPPSEKPPLVSTRGTYLVTGGLSGFGLSVGQWLVQHGARHLVLVGRRGAATPEAQEAVQRMAAQGVRVVVAPVDVTSAEQVDQLVDEISRTMPPLRGIFHAAMVLDDGYLLQLNQSRFARVMAPKVAGTWNLHRATLNAPVDYFVMFSSISSLMGAPGQGNYSAANAFLDAFAHYRRALGRPALTVNWGVIAGVGYVARNADVSRYLGRQGHEGLPHLDAETILEGLLRSGRSHVAAIRADLSKLAAFAPSSQWSRRLSLLQSDASAIEGSGARDQRGALLNQLRSASAPQRVELLQAALRKALAGVLKISADRIEPHQAISGLGLDSLMAVEFEARLKSEVSSDITVGFLASGDSTLRQLTERLLEQIVSADSAAEAVPEAHFASAAAG